MSAEQRKALEKRLLDEYEVYDTCADIVSAFEWLFTDPTVKAMPSTVRHFERYPTVVSDMGMELTPDFTVLFNDGTAIVGEIAKIPLADQGVDRLCDQIGKYATVTAIPAGSGSASASIDVMLLVPMANGNNAYQRIIQQRMLDTEHPYSPPKAPAIVQFAREASGYTFQRLLAANNGSLDAGQRNPHIQKYLDQGFRPPAERFVRVKIAKPFINDSMSSLYLATHLWTRVWPDQYGNSRDAITVDATKTAELLRERFGEGRTADVKHALELLDAVGLAADSTGRNLGRVSRRDH